MRRNVTLEPCDHATVRRHADQWGHSFSGALRYIIREWDSLKLAIYIDALREEPAGDSPD